MLRKILVGMITVILLSYTLHALSANILDSLLAAGKEPTDCGQALPTSDPGFCNSFKKVAICNCSQNLPDGMCQNMNQIYDRMTSILGSQEKACKYQEGLPTSHTDYQTCMDDWNCYRKGGRDSHGQLCSSTGKACP